MSSPSYRIVEHDPNWPIEFEEEKTRVLGALRINEERIKHIGSTSIPGLGAEPIVDITVGIPTMEQASFYLTSLERIGYEWRDYTVPGTWYIRKELPWRFNLHMTEYGNEFWLVHLLFRDHLRTHHEIARTYESLKRNLMAKFATEPRIYNESKTEFIQGVVSNARAEYGQSTGATLPR